MANFFQVHASPERSFVCVDLPGYGFNKVANDVRQEWDTLVKKYLERPAIKNLLFLMDVRRQLDEQEITFLRSLRPEHHLMLVVTKCDKVNQQERSVCELALKKIIDTENLPVSAIHCVSSLKKTGIDQLRTLLFCRPGGWLA